MSLAHALTRAATALTAGRLPSADDRNLVTAVLRCIVDGGSAASALAAAARSRRDDELRRVRQQHYGDLSTSAAADQLSTDALRYEASGWRLDRLRSDCPHLPGSLRADLWTLLHLGEIPKRRRLIDIFGVCAVDGRSDCTNSLPN